MSTSWGKEVRNHNSLTLPVRTKTEALWSTNQGNVTGNGTVDSCGEKNKKEISCHPPPGKKYSMTIQTLSTIIFER